jgi:hypothetical protein
VNTGGGDSTSGGAVYGDLLKDELEAQEARKSSLEQRGLAVVTTSGALVTLLFALGALSTKASETFTLTGHAPTYLAIALIGFIAAAVAALGTNIPLRYEAVKADEIKNRLDDSEFVLSEDKATKDVALTRVKVLKSAKEKNGIKAMILLVAMGLEVIAVGFVGAAIWVVISP